MNEPSPPSKREATASLLARGVESVRDITTIAVLATKAGCVGELLPEREPDPEIRDETEVEKAVRTYGRVEVVIRNVITQEPMASSKAAWEAWGGSGFAQEFDNLDDALGFAEEHKWFFNNCSVLVSYVAGYETRTEQVPAYSGSWTAPMVDREVTYSVWRDVPGWVKSGPDRWFRECVDHVGDDNDGRDLAPRTPG